MKKTRAIAFSGMLCALCLTLLLIGSLIGIGTYAAPMIASVLLMPVGMVLGVKYHLCAWAAVSLLGLIILPDREEALMFANLFGWYPIAKPYFDRMKKPFGAVCRYASLNICAIATEALVMLVIAPEAESIWMLLVLLAVANLIFRMYDLLIPKFALLLKRRLINRFKL